MCRIKKLNKQKYQILTLAFETANWSIDASQTL